MLARPVPGALRWAFLALLMLFGGLPAAEATTALPGSQAEAERPTAAAPGPLRKTVIYVQRMQASLQRDLTRAVREMKSADSSGPFFFLALLSFLYGIFHAAGPGHGKVVISSYLLAHESRVKRGIQLAFLSSTAQAFSAVALVGLFALLLDFSRLETTGQVRWLEIASYALIVGIGGWMLYATLRGKRCGHDHGPGHDHGSVNEGADRPGRLRLGHMAALVMAVGIRPCSGAIIVLLFTLAQGMFLAGVGATFAMAVGTAITVSALALFTVLSRKAAMRVAGGNSVWAGRINKGLGIAGSLAVLLFGVLLLAAALDQSRPLGVY